MPATETQPLETIIGPLAPTLPYLKPETIQCADQLINERRTNHKLRNQWFITGDFLIYRCENVEGQEEPEAFLYLARADKNLIFHHPDEAIPQLVGGDHNYRLDSKSIDEIARDPNTLKIQLSELTLKGDNTEWKHLEIDTTNYATTLNGEENKLAERIYGSMKPKKDEATGKDTSDFAENMAMLKAAKINTTKIYVLNPDSVGKETQYHPIARAGWLGVFGGGAWFVADGWGVDVAVGALRGVRRQEEAPAGGAPENDIVAAYTALLANPDAAAKGLTPERVAGLSAILAKYGKP